MTMVAGIAAAEGVVCIGDGKAYNEKQELLTDEEVKLFEVSPYCVIMPNGGVMDNVAEVMEFIRATLNKYIKDDPNTQNPSFIAKQLAEILNKVRGIDKEDPYGFIVAGVETLEDGEKAPILFNIESIDWQPKMPKEPFIVGGIIQPALTTIRDGFGKPNDRIRNVNRLAVKAMLETIKADDIVGGKIALWNVTEKGIKKYDQKGIDILMKDL